MATRQMTHPTPSQLATCWAYMPYSTARAQARSQRWSAQDSDINGIVDVRYTGGARMLLLVEIGRGAWTVKVPVLVSDLDLECKLWLKLRLAPMRRALVTRMT